MTGREKAAFLPSCLLAFLPCSIITNYTWPMTATVNKIAASSIQGHLGRYHCLYFAMHFLCTIDAQSMHIRCTFYAHLCKSITPLLFIQTIAFDSRCCLHKLDHKCDLLISHRAQKKSERKTCRIKGAKKGPEVTSVGLSVYHSGAFTPSLPTSHLPSFSLSYKTASILNFSNPTDPSLISLYSPYLVAPSRATPNVNPATILSEDPAMFVCCSYTDSEMHKIPCSCAPVM